MKKLIGRLYDAVAQKGHVCIGLDTDVTYLPPGFAGRFGGTGKALLAFNREIIDATLDAAAVYKVQIAYYEALGLEGLEAYRDTLRYLRQQNAIVIADVKRGDIAKTAEMYAKAHFSGDFEADFITVNPFMGMDTLEPFFPYLRDHDKGLFALVATSNPGAADIEGIAAADGESVTEKTGTMLAKLAEQFEDTCGYSAIGAVVGCTNKERTAALRAKLHNLFFLIPGYGAQGGTAQDIRTYLQNGNGGVVNSSRGILLAWKKPEHESRPFQEAARAEVIQMRDDIRHAVL